MIDLVVRDPKSRTAYNGAFLVYGKQWKLPECPLHHANLTSKCYRYLARLLKTQECFFYPSDSLQVGSLDLAGVRLQSRRSISSVRPAFYIADQFQLRNTANKRPLSATRQAYIFSAHLPFRALRVSKHPRTLSLQGPDLYADIIAS